MNKSFTLVEILVVTTIIVLMTATAAVSYSSFLKQSRDARRKSDIEQVRAAIEMYRSNNDTYPVGDWSSLGVLTSGTVYLQSLPVDPRSPTYSYYYSGSAADYTLGSYLETGAGTGTCGGSCTVSCNYCAGPYGVIANEAAPNPTPSGGAGVPSGEMPTPTPTSGMGTEPTPTVDPKIPTATPTTGTGFPPTPTNSPI